MLKQSIPGPRQLKILYSPLHGVGESAVCPALAGAGFTDVEVFGPHATPDGDFPNVPKHIANPENAVVFDAMIEHGRQVGTELILATDPDCDRLGAAALRSTQPGAAWATLTGNQIGSLLADYLLSSRHAAGTLTPKHYIVKTLVTTELMRRIAESYGVVTAGDLLVGFKYIGAEIDRRGPREFVFAAEESYGFLAGDHVRDKDGAVAAMLLCELAASLKAEGRTLHEKLDDLFRRHGCHTEGQISVQMPGEKGMDDMKALMAGLRNHPPAAVAGMRVAQVRDYLNDVVILPSGQRKPLSGPTGDLVIFDLAAGRQLRGDSPLRHRAQGEVLHVRFRWAGSQPRPCRDQDSPVAAIEGDGSRPADDRGHVGKSQENRHSCLFNKDIQECRPPEVPCATGFASVWACETFIVRDVT